MQPHFFAAAVLLMAAYTFKRDDYVRIDVFSGFLGAPGLAWLDLGGIVVVLLLPPSVIAVGHLARLRHVVRDRESRASRESLSRFPAWIMKGMIPLGFLTLAAQAPPRCELSTRYAEARVTGRLGRGGRCRGGDGASCNGAASCAGLECVELRSGTSSRRPTRAMRTG